MTATTATSTPVPATGKKKTPARRPRRPRPYRSPATPPGGSTAAKRTAAVLLEVLSGRRGTTEASQELGVSLSRYYVLEARGLQGLVSALEPRPRGKQKTPAAELAEARQEVKRLEREVARLQALVRASQRTLGIKAVPAAGKRSKLGASSGKKKTRRRRTVRRAAQMIERLRTPSATAAAATSAEAGPCRPDDLPRD